MEDVLRAVALGVIQGLTEFLPISSSGHLIIARDLFGWEFSDDLTFDVALHLGTTVALLAYFWREWRAMLAAGLRWATNGGNDPDPHPVYSVRLLAILALGSIPAAAVGFVVDRYFEDDLRDPIIAGAMLIAFGLVLFGAENTGSRSREVKSARWPDGLLVGTAQAISLIPGVSRAGVTITGALARGFSRGEAARFSFLLATPIIIGAGLLKITEAIFDGIASSDVDAIFAGAIVAAVVGFLSIHYLLRLVQSGTYLPFVVYRLAVGAFVIVYFAV